MTRKYVLPALAIVCAAVFVLQPVGVFAQSSQGGLRGAVKDSQGVIPGVTVTLVNEATASRAIR
jgi:hypothetical protein